MMKKISRRQFLHVSAVAGAGAVLASCKTPIPEETPTVTEKPADVEATATAVPPTEVPEEPTDVPVAEQVWPRVDVPRERTLNFGNGVGGVGIGNVYAGVGHQQQSCMMEGMFYYAVLADKTTNWLAESYEYNDDATELTVFLRKGVMWNDGVPFTAKDVAFTYNMLRDFAPVLRDSSPVKNTTQNVEAVDDYTVKFTLTESNYRYHFTMCTYRMDRGVYLVPEHIFNQFTSGEEIAEWTQWDPDQGVVPVHTGPYQLVRTEEQFREYQLLYNWWAIDVGLMDHMPYPESITFISRPADDIAAQLVINSELDTTMGISPKLHPVALAQAGDHVTTFTGHDKPYGYVDWWPSSLYFNTLEAPYDDPRVRWAFAYAIDQNQLVEVAWEEAGTVSNSPFPNYPGLVKYLDGAKDILEAYNVLEQDLDKVEQLMTDAGFVKDADSFWAKDGETLQVDVVGATPPWADLAPITAEQLRAAGFNANHISPPDVWTQLTDGRAKVFFQGHTASVWDPYLTMWTYHSQHVRPTGENCGENRPRWGNEEFDAVVEEMSRTSPDSYDKMQELFNKGMEIWYRELPEVPIVQWYHRILYSTTYWTNWANKDNPYNTGNWHITFPITLWNLEPTT
ncbi:MAG: ABC transporter substrate-binding protein [Anaerolineae bacterium]|nr:ABC transporter substrate-binding protein [Anaerolineae bacterium]